MRMQSALDSAIGLPGAFDLRVVVVALVMPLE